MRGHAGRIIIQHFCRRARRPGPTFRSARRISSKGGQRTARWEFGRTIACCTTLVDSVGERSILLLYLSS